ncbi:SDR family oxidoreductase [Nocardia cyriacigeorgica]|uniref:SDR family oxidoreductase n=1 Tax=Nocardia cyriacigeorgica TaxID=135487 RepID=UPI001895AAFC|nr:SDR family oxidoreductase [Nocardia cyriacigeorgica]MBF6440291.1 SDR family oxidoreductase [Nocardia cyriacigeorgica]MBF6457097.1 SDR family oxidoreductase [Nocardia cyriacigeorgica]MBF6481701.1 SDR family oxidoreductase [Nocardia cyriacigeorgica]MBF6554242.1 SDR family oxidoreductase [Nocardia cyriacigeorgica]
MKVNGKTAIVTGAGRGIGAAICARLVDAGAHVVAADLDGDAAGQVADELCAIRPDAAVAVAGDVADENYLRELIAAAEHRFGPVQLYFANAGIPGRAGLGDDEGWRLAFDVHVQAHVRAARLLVEGWVARGEGYFVSTASAAGLLTQIGAADYSVTKHAAVAFAEWLSVTYGDKGIRVSCLCPMGVDTAMLQAGVESGDRWGAAAARAVTEAGAVLRPEDVAAQVLDAIGDERFLILPHPEVGEMHRQKASDYDRWLGGMRRYQASLLAVG